MGYKGVHIKYAGIPRSSMGLVLRKLTDAGLIIQAISGAPTHSGQ